MWAASVAKPNVFSVPRRFDLAAVLVAMSAFAILFAGLLLLDASPAVLALLGGFLAIVAAAQWIGSKWNRPRTASIIAGVLVYWVVHIAGAYFSPPPRMGWPQAVAVMLFSGTLSGIIAAYLGGALVGGVFLVSHYLREWLGRGERDPVAAQPRCESPWEEKHPLNK